MRRKTLCEAFGGVMRRLREERGGGDKNAASTPSSNAEAVWPFSSVIVAMRHRPKKPLRAGWARMMACPLADRPSTRGKPRRLHVPPLSWKRIGNARRPRAALNVPNEMTSCREAHRDATSPADAPCTACTVTTAVVSRIAPHRTAIRSKRRPKRTRLPARAGRSPAPPRNREVTLAERFIASSRRAPTT